MIIATRLTVDIADRVLVLGSRVVGMGRRRALGGGGRMARFTALA
jgi:hypothetical protein